MRSYDWPPSPPRCSRNAAPRRTVPRHDPSLQIDTRAAITSSAPTGHHHTQCHHKRRPLHAAARRCHCPARSPPQRRCPTGHIPQHRIHSIANPGRDLADRVNGGIFPNRNCRRPHKHLVLKSRPSHRLSAPIKSPAQLPTPPRTATANSPSFLGLLTPPPATTTACSRSPPRSRLHSLSLTKVRGRIDCPRAPLRFPHLPIVAMTRLAGNAASRPSRAAPSPFSVQNQWG
jgi:hypothetical protein